MKAVAEKCCTDAFIYELPGVHYHDAIKLTETAILKEKEYDTRDIVAISLDELCRNIEYMSRGMPLALHCLSAEAADSVRQENYDGWNTCIKHVQDAFLSIRSLKPLADSLGLVYDSLPIDLKTCLLYCTTYPDFHSEKVLTEAQGIERQDLVRKWMAEGFVPRLEAAETYFDELVSRNLLLVHHTRQRFYQIQPLMLPFLVCKSKEANFVTRWLDDHGSAKRIRRLVIHQSDSVYDSETFVTYSSMRRQHGSFSHVSSLIVCFRRSQHGPVIFDEGWHFVPSFKNQFPCFDNWSFKMLGHLRVLDLEQIINIEDDDLVRICKLLLLRYLGLKYCSGITVLPREIGRLQNLETLDISSTGVTDLPMEIGELWHLETLNVSNTRIREIPREIGKVQHLKTLNLSNTRVVELPWERSLLSNSVSVLVGYKNGPQLVKFPNGLHPIWLAWKNGTIASSARAMRRQDLSIMLFDHFGSSSGPLPVPGLKLSSRHTNIPQWVKEHLTDVSSLDIRICRLEEEDLKFLQQMPNLQVLALRLEILPREPISFTAGGFSKLESFLVDCRLPLVTFKQGAMPCLKHLEFKFYTGRASVHPIGITNLRSIQKVVFWCSKYYTSDCSGIAAMLKVVKEEAMEHPKRISLRINDSEEVFPEKGAEVSEENSINAATGSSAECGIKTTLAASAIDHKGKAIQVSDYAYASCSRTTKIQEIEEAQE